jgi:hypothetical protein
MTCPYLGNENYKLAAGYNQAGSLATLEGILPSGDIFAFQPVSGGFQDYDPGVLKIGPTGEYRVGGYASTVWRLSFVTAKQEAYLRDTFCSSGHSGEVTMRTDTVTALSFANYNAVILLPKRSDLIYKDGVFRDYRILYTRLVAL